MSSVGSNSMTGRLAEVRRVGSEIMIRLAEREDGQADELQQVRFVLEK